MPRINIDPTEIKKHPKFHAFRKKMDFSVHHAFGVLCAFWGEVANTEANESGDISDWTPDYLADRIGVSCDPARLWEALLPGYIEVRQNDRYFVRDWLEIAGDFLREKWRSRRDGVQHLTEIWGNYRRLYGRSTEPKSGPPVDVQMGHSETTVNPQWTHSETTVDPNDAKNRRISDPEIGPLRSSLSMPLPSSHPEEDLKAFTLSRGRDEKSRVGFDPDGSEKPEKIPAAVTILQKLFVEQLAAKYGQTFDVAAATFNFGAAGAGFKRLLKAGCSVQEIEARFDPWMKSTDGFIVKRGHRITDFFSYFPALKDGPIANQVGTNGAKEFYDGANSVEPETQFTY